MRGDWKTNLLDLLWPIIRRVGPLRRWLNGLLIDAITTCTMARPLPHSLWGPKSNAPSPPVPPDLQEPSATYVSWPGLTDRNFTGRHLPSTSDEQMKGLPEWSQVEPLLARKAAMTPCPRSSALFCFFAQWFTDSFLRTDPSDVRRNTSNHEIDLCQIYGLTAADTRLLRVGRDGLLKSRQTANGEFPEQLFESTGAAVRPDFSGLSYVDPASRLYRHKVIPPHLDLPDRRSRLHAAGLERGNSTIVYSALNTVFLREHNRLAKQIARHHKLTDDDEIFELARNTNIAQLIRIIILDYINHLSSTRFRFVPEIGFAERKSWYRTNRISAEFNILYRWHALVPDEFVLHGHALPEATFRFNNALLEDEGIAPVLAAAAAQRAGRIGLRNTPGFLIEADKATFNKSRSWRLQPYNAYRTCFGLPKVASFKELTGDGEIADKLETLYGDVDRVDLMVGLLAEDRASHVVLGPLMMTMVAVDAFSQALTNPLLSRNIYGPAAFSESGLKCIGETNTLDDIVQRNVDMGEAKASFGVRPLPGSYGPPVIGRLSGILEFFVFGGWMSFFERRRKKFGSVFRTNLFQPTIALLDGQAIEPLFADRDLVQDYGFSWARPPLPLVGGVRPSIFNAGPDHDRWKALYLDLIRLRASSLDKILQQKILERTDRWSRLGHFGWRDEVEDFTADFIFSWLLQMQVDPAEIRLVYNNLFLHFATWLTRWLPWSTYSRSLRAYDRLVQQVQSAPSFTDILGLATQHGLDDRDQIAKQILFLCGMNSFLGTQSMIKSLVGELSRQPDLADRLRDELDTAGVTFPAGLSEIERLPLLDGTLREVLRLHPPVTFIFGRATKRRVIESQSGPFEIAPGELLMGVIPFVHLDPAYFAAPHQFDPERHMTPGAGQWLIWPRGQHDATVSPSDRTCPGKDVAMLIGKAVCASLVRCRWRLQDPVEWDQRRFSLNVAAPRGPLTVLEFGRIAG